jgi:hypothetical protein
MGFAYRREHDVPMEAMAWQVREGGVKVVFDVPEADVDDVIGLVAAGGFAVERYYRDEPQHGEGRAPARWIRLGAELRMTTFTEAEQEGIVSRFDALHRESGFTCGRQGTERW